MHFWSKCFLLYILSYAVVGSPELEFDIMTLGGSELLIFWDPMNITDANNKYFRGEVSNSSFKIEDVTVGQYKIHSLHSDTRYEIKIEEHKKNKNESVKSYSIQGKTSCLKKDIGCMKKYSFPEKPYFTWRILESDYGQEIQIKWIPCGEKRNCYGKEPGTHFAVKYKILELRRTLIRVEHNEGHYNIQSTFAGRIYEMIVVSIADGNFETESDPQEVFHVPSSGSVRSVRVLTLSNNSTYISWKKPRQSVGEVKRYTLHYRLRNIKELHWETSIEVEEEPPRALISKKIDHYQIILQDLKPHTVYPVFIVPFVGDHYGLEFRFDYSVQPIEANLTLARPDFIFELISSTSYSCTYSVYWIPCAEKFDCANMSPGIGFKLIWINGNETKTYTEKEYGYINLNYLKRNQTYTIIGKSINEIGESSDSVTKTITIPKT